MGCDWPDRAHGARYTSHILRCVVFHRRRVGIARHTWLGRHPMVGGAHPTNTLRGMVAGASAPADQGGQLEGQFAAKVRDGATGAGRGTVIEQDRYLAFTLHLIDQPVQIVRPVDNSFVQVHQQHIHVLPVQLLDEIFINGYGHRHLQSRSLEHHFEIISLPIRVRSNGNAQLSSRTNGNTASFLSGRLVQRLIMYLVGNRGHLLPQRQYTALLLIASNIFNGLRADARYLFSITIHQRRVAQQVDQPGDTATVAEHRLAGLVVEHIGAPAGDAQAMPDILARLLGVERREVVVHGNSLRELLQARIPQVVAQPGLTRKYHLQYLVLIAINVGEHAQLFQRLWTHVLGLINDQDRTTIGRILLYQEIHEGLIHIDLFFTVAFKIECQQNPLKQFAKRGMGVGNQSHHHVALHLVEELADQRSLAGADITCDDAEAGLIHQAVFQQSQRHLVLFAEIKKLRIRQERKWLAPKTIKRFVHNQLFPLRTRL